MVRLACGVEYDGTDYHGFQRQSESRGLTIQGVLEAAIVRISGTMSVVYGAGRTDAGVHARGQVIHFTTSSQLTPDAWMRALNALLPAAVAITWIQEVPESFHARYSARSRSYCYTIWNDPAPSALQARYSYYRSQELDTDLMQLACQLLLGRKDFGAFGRSPYRLRPLKTGIDPCVRIMFEAECIRQQTVILFNFTANAFLTGQVRRMVGTLLQVGQKRLSLDGFAMIVQQARKTHSGSAVPPHGLCLVKVSYPDEVGVIPTSRVSESG